MSLRRVYETTIIINAALEDNDVDAVIGKVTGYIENNGGTIQETNKWGRRRLAYPINKKFNGFYTHIIFESAPEAIPLLDRFMVLEDTVLRHLTLQLSDALREQRKQNALAEGKRLAEKEAAERPAPKREAKKEVKEAKDTKEVESAD